MKTLAWTVIALSAVLSAGCAANNTDLAAEFRQKMANDPNGHQSSITTYKSSEDVINIIKNRAAPCLDREVSIKVQNQYSQTTNKKTLKYTPTLVVNKSSAVLSVQLLINGGGLAAGKTPEKGMYTLIADIEPISQEQTRLDIYRNEYHGAAMIEKSIKDWVIRKSLKCPNLNRY